MDLERYLQISEVVKDVRGHLNIEVRCAWLININDEGVVDDATAASNPRAKENVLKFIAGTCNITIPEFREFGKLAVEREHDYYPGWV